MDKSFKKWLRGTFINPIHFQKLASICLICEFIFAAAVSYCHMYLGAYRQSLIYDCLGRDELFFDFDYFIIGGYNRSAGDFGLNFCQARHLPYFLGQFLRKLFFFKSVICQKFQIFAAHFNILPNKLNFSFENYSMQVTIQGRKVFAKMWYSKNCQEV